MKHIALLPLDLAGLTGNIVARYVTDVGMNVSLATFATWAVGVAALSLFGITPDIMRLYVIRPLSRVVIRR